MSPTSNPILDCLVRFPFCDAAAATAALLLVSDTGVLSRADESPSTEADAELGAVAEAAAAAAVALTANSDGWRAISQPSKVRSNASWTLRERMPVVLDMMMVRRSRMSYRRAIVLVRKKAQDVLTFRSGAQAGGLKPTKEKYS